MYSHLIAFLMATLLSPMCFAGTVTLYTCEKQGEVFLLDTPAHDCDRITQKTYGPFKAVSPSSSEDDASLGLRPLEQALLFELNAMHFKHNTDIADALFQREKDARHDKCFFFKTRIREAIDDLKFQPGVRVQGDLERQIQRDIKEAKYYCTPD